MRITLPDIRSLLAVSALYQLFTRMIGGNARALYATHHIRPKNGDRVLDIGCGSADILSYLPHVEYVGLDMSRKYINAARKHFGTKGTFLTKKVSNDTMKKLSLSDFDIVLATAVLHHLNDDEAIQLFEIARSTLKPHGRLITLDGCYTKGQSWLRRFLLSKDRGRYVRTEDQYCALASGIFPDIKISIHHNLIRIPYTHIIMECTT